MRGAVCPARRRTRRVGRGREARGGSSQTGQPWFRVSAGSTFGRDLLTHQRRSVCSTHPTASPPGDRRGRKHRQSMNMPDKRMRGGAIAPRPERSRTGREKVARSVGKCRIVTPKGGGRTQRCATLRSCGWHHNSRRPFAASPCPASTCAAAREVHHLHENAKAVHNEA